MDVKQLVSQTKEAQKKYATFSQEQVDKIFYAAAKAANAARIPLAKMAVKETGMGVVEDKVIKNHYASEYIYNKYKNLKTCGVYESDNGKGYELMYEPMGVVAAIIPTTNPTSTAIFKALISLKTRNACVISAHPRAFDSTTAAAKIVLDAAVAAGAPEGIINWLPKGAPFDATGTLMAEADVILATGGSGLVKAAYSSGTPAIGVGAGNCPSIIDSSADVKTAVSSIIQSNTFDFGVVCATENSLVVLEDVYAKVVEEFKKQYGYIVSNEDDKNNIRKKMFKEGSFGLLNADMVGQGPQRLAEIFNIKVPQSTKLIVVEAESTDYKEALAHEKLSCFVSMYKAKDFDHALQIQKELLLLGPGHTSALWVDECLHPEKIDAFKNSAMTARLVVNMPSAMGGIGDLYNFHLEPSLTLGCGTWGGNMFSENIGPIHLLNKKQVTKRRENMLWLRVPSRIYFKYGCVETAFVDLKEKNRKRIFIVTDTFIWGKYGDRISKPLEKLGMTVQAYTGVKADPSLSACKAALEELKRFKPDVIIAFGGGSSLDEGKLLWLFNQYPNVDFKDLALRFADIRKRICEFPPIDGEKCEFVCIPTTTGTGSEVTPFAVITDDETNIKYPLASYEIIPSMAIVDSQFTLEQPPMLTAVTGADAMSHAFESYVSLLANDFTKPYSIQSIKLLFKYLERAVKNGETDREARDAIIEASTLAGIAFGNAFLGINHSLAHKMGGHFHVPHGQCNAIYLPYVVRYNAETGNCDKQGYFSQYKTPCSLERYAEIATAIGITGKTDVDKVNKLIAALQKLFKNIGIPASTKESGVDTAKFNAILDQMAEEAFDDQCTGANPRYPAIEDLKQIFKDAHEGNEIKKL